MKRTNVGLLLGIAFLSVTLVGTAQAAPPGDQGPVLGSKLEAMAWYDTTEPLNIRFSLENRNAESVWVLRWQVPSNDIDANILEVTRDGEAVSYIGRLVKRAEPIADDYIQISAGATYSVMFDPSAAYDMSAQGDYSVRYRVDMLDVRTVAPDSEKATPPTMRAPVVDSSAIRLWFEGIEKMEPESAQIIGGYANCTTSQKSSMQTAHNNAISISGKAKQHLATYPSGSSLYTWWFGTYTSSRFSTVKSHYNAISDAFVNKSVVYDCGCKQNYYAYVYPSQPYKIYVCNAFWSAPNLGRDSRAGTLVHEMSHFYVVASTDDWVYGATGAHKLAVKNPKKAVDNADNHEYFAEDQ